jgi:hypothetical protein
MCSYSFASFALTKCSVLCDCDREREGEGKDLGLPYKYNMLF